MLSARPPLSSADHHQHRPDVLRRAPGSGRTQCSHRCLPDGAEVVTHERLHHQSRRLHLLQQEGDGRQRKLHQRGVTADRHARQQARITSATGL